MTMYRIVKTTYQVVIRFSLIHRSQDEVDSSVPNYMSALYEYMKTLSQLRADIVGDKNTSGLDYCNEMYVSVTSTIGEMIFEHQADPAMIEAALSKYGVDVTAEILNNCYPRISADVTPRKCLLLSVLVKS